MFDTNNTLKSKTNNQLHAMNHKTVLYIQSKHKSICISYAKFGWESTP